MWPLYSQLEGLVDGEWITSSSRDRWLSNLSSWIQQLITWSLAGQWELCVTSWSLNFVVYVGRDGGWWGVIFAFKKRELKEKAQDAKFSLPIKDPESAIKKRIPDSKIGQKIGRIPDPDCQP